MHHKINNLWKIEYELIVNEDSILLYSRGKIEEAKIIWSELNLEEAIAKQIEELPFIFGDIENGKPAISGNEVKGIFRHFISASLASKGHKICVPDTKRHVKEITINKKEERKYYIPIDRIEQCSPEKLCFVCKYFGTSGYESPLYFSFLICDKKFKEVLSNVVPLIAFDEQFGGSAGGALVSFIGIKGGTKFYGEIDGINLDNRIIGAIYDVVKASEKKFIKFGRLRSRGFGTATIKIKKIIKYSVAPFNEEAIFEGEELEDFLKKCWNEYKEFASKPSEPEEIEMKEAKE
jgi:CRISPR/Cas system CSM-associated protein Csm3 (group 7 of RAMP superfamily)